MSYHAHLFLFWGLCSTAPGFTSPDPFPPQIEKAYQQILALKIEEGRKILNSHSQKDIPSFHYVANLAEVLELLITEDPSLYKTYQNHEKERLAFYRELSATQPYRNFYLAEIKLSWAFVKLKFGEEFSAAWAFRQAYKLIHDNSQIFPDYLSNNKTLGLLHVIIGSIPEKYQWFVNLMGMEGSMDQGVDELTLLTQTPNTFQQEALLLVSIIKAYLLQEHQLAMNQLDQFYQQHPGHYLAAYLYISVAMKNHASERALMLLRDLNHGEDGYLKFPYLEYLKGEIFLQKGRYDSALYSYGRFLNSFKGQNLIKDTYYKIFLSYWLDGDKNRADSMYLAARKQGLKNAEADRHAHQQLRNPYPHTQLMRIRLLTDGGYYQEADELINQLNPTLFETIHQSTEFIYRQARLFHLQQLLPQATNKYLTTIAMSIDNSWYFAPNSALQLGYIFRDQGDEIQARQYFEKALNYKKHVYKNSIDNKARSALASLERNNH